MGKTYQTKKYIKMYKAGFSTYQIAEKFGVTRSNVCLVLKYWEIKLRHLGDDIEVKVKDWLQTKGYKVVHQKGDRPFDLFVDEEKVDVKSAHKSYDKWHNRFGYVFQLQDRFNRIKSKNLQKKVDNYYLVFLDEDKEPVYKLPSKEITATQTLRISAPFKTKYQLQFIGNLEGR